MFRLGLLPLTGCCAKGRRMMQSTRNLALITCLLSPGCVVAHNYGVPVIEPDGRNVMLSTVPPNGCEPRGDVYGKSSSGDDAESSLRGARYDIRKRAAQVGANYVAIQNTATGRSSEFTRQQNEVVISGAAFRCPTQAPSAPMASASAGSAVPATEKKP
jgi:hypothetical protein